MTAVKFKEYSLWCVYIEAEDIREIFDEIESSPVMETLWKTYQKNYSYAADISWHAIVKSICALYGSILENMYDT